MARIEAPEARGGVVKIDRDAHAEGTTRWAWLRDAIVRPRVRRELSTDLVALGCA